MIGFAVGNPTGTVILRATVVMVISWLVGQVIGSVALKTVDRHIEQYKLDHPMPPCEPETIFADEVPEPSPGQTQAPESADSATSIQPASEAA